MLSYVIFSSKPSLCQVKKPLRKCQNETPLEHFGVSNSVLRLVSSYERTATERRDGKMSILIQHVSRLESQRWIGKSDSGKCLTGIVFVVEENSSSTSTFSSQHSCNKTRLGIEMGRVSLQNVLQFKIYLEQEERSPRSALLFSHVTVKLFTGCC